MIWLLLLIGLLFISFVHLIVPICVAAVGKPHKKSSLWWIAIAGGLIGFVVCALMQEEFRGLAGIIQSTFWTIISFFILKKRCFTRYNTAVCKECGNKLSINSSFCSKCGAQVKKDNE